MRQPPHDAQISPAEGISCPSLSTPFRDMRSMRSIYRPRLAIQLHSMARTSMLQDISSIQTSPYRSNVTLELSGSIYNGTARTTGRFVFNLTSPTVNGSYAVRVNATVENVTVNTTILLSVGVLAADTTLPAVHLILPANSSNDTDGIVAFQCNISDNVQVKNLTIWVYNTTGLFFTNTTNLGNTFNATSFAVTLTTETDIIGHAAAAIIHLMR